jgi:hypothetical protein
MLNLRWVSGGRAQQGYIRDANSREESSLHWFGLVQASMAGSELRFETVMQAASGEVTVQDGKVGSLYVEKLAGASGVFFAETSELADGSLDWNPDDKTAIGWPYEKSVDSGTYSLNNEEIQVKKAGSYCLVYNDALSADGGRPSPRVTVEVNGEEVPGAQTKTHYIRNSGGHTKSSATLAFLLNNLRANDVVTLSVQREANAPTTTADPDIVEGAIVGLIKKEDFTAGPDEGLPPRVFAFQGGLWNVSSQIEDFSTKVNADTVAMTLDGEALSPVVTKSGAVTTVSYAVPEFFDSV